MQAPTIHFNEFSYYTTSTGEDNGFSTVDRVHPEFGSWKEKSLDLDHIRIYEHRATLTRKVNVLFDDGSVENYVHHCMAVEGEMGANFLDHGLSANLTPQSFHHLFLPGKEYFLGMGSQFLNVHIEVKRDYYLNLLCDNEEWSAELKRKLLDNHIYYPGEFRLSAPMLQTIHAIFNSPLSGSLKKLLIEAKVHELVAMQLHHSVNAADGKSPKNRADVFHYIREYLDRTFLEEHSLKSIARHFGINEFALKRGFRENFNTTVFEYILSKRLQHSYDLLRDTDRTIHEVGSEVGYKYPNHFSVAFRKKFGLNPSEVRG